ncbi:hypothetical protein KC361_g126 [Hortaea werneckii]|nr:hypothetical protein KC361_g126 [Hortaea werneckii]
MESPIDHLQPFLTSLESASSQHKNAGHNQDSNDCLKYQPRNHTCVRFIIPVIPVRPSNTPYWTLLGSQGDSVSYGRPKETQPPRQPVPRRSGERRLFRLRSLRSRKVPESG